MEFVSTLAPSSRISTEEARGSSSPPDPTMSNKHGCSGRSLESDLHNQLLCRSQFPSRWIFTYKKGRLHLTKIILPPFMLADLKAVCVLHCGGVTSASRRRRADGLGHAYPRL
ncbi:unnamed protein product [Brassica oleracea]